MNIRFTEKALVELQHWKDNEPSKVARIRALLENIQHTPYKGIGKPEPLLFDLHGYWSRRIDREHRLVYVVENDTITVLACRYHYAK